MKTGDWIQVSFALIFDRLAGIMNLNSHLPSQVEGIEFH